MSHNKFDKYNVKLLRSDHCNFIDVPFLLPKYSEKGLLVPKASEVVLKMNQTCITVLSYLSEIKILDYKIKKHFTEFDFIKTI